jgi:hypothetical protein
MRVDEQRGAVFLQVNVTVTPSHERRPLPVTLQASRTPRATLARDRADTNPTPRIHRRFSWTAKAARTTDLWPTALYWNSGIKTTGKEISSNDPKKFKKNLSFREEI